MDNRGYTAPPDLIGEEWDNLEPTYFDDEVWIKDYTPQWEPKGAEE